MTPKRPFYFRQPCEHCGADPFWWNNWERNKHVNACETIEKGLKLAKLPGSARSTQGR